MKYTHKLTKPHDFNLDHIFDCGQCFRWEKQPDGSYTGIAFGKVVNMSLSEEPPQGVNFVATQKPREAMRSRQLAAAITSHGEGGYNNMYPGFPQFLTIDNCTPEDFNTIWRPYLDLDRDYSKIKTQFSEADPTIRKAINYGGGIRILRQDLWETLVSFIISQNNNIPRIKGCINNLSAAFGTSAGTYAGPAVAPSAGTDAGAGTYAGPAVAPSAGSDDSTPAGVDTSAAAAPAPTSASPATDASTSASSDVIASASAAGREYFNIPTPEVLAALTAEDLAPIKLGYRARYLIETASAVCRFGLPQNFDQLSALCGVGPKVANCVSLFGLGNLDSFPIDVWVRRVMNQLYGIDEKDVKAMAAFAAKTFGQYGGIAQQYLFYYMRSIG